MNIIERLYLLGYRWRQSRAHAGRKRLPRPVVSIGNITVGGTGKTPAAMAVAEAARLRGWQPVILTRGYRGAAQGPCFVSMGAGRLLSAAEAGDEPALMADRLRGIPIVKSPDRYAGGIFAIERLAGEPALPLLFVLDDGFQHRQLHRDIDIVLVDGLNPFGNGRLLPLGPLRGPLDELGRADFILVTKSRNDRLMNTLSSSNEKAAVFGAAYEARMLLHADGTTEPAGSMRGRRVYAFCGIANPEGFRKTLDWMGVVTAGFKAYRDHHNYTASDLARIAADAGRLGAEWIVTTEKDMVKIRELGAEAKVSALAVDFIVDGAFYEEIFSKLERL